MTTLGLGAGKRRARAGVRAPWLLAAALLPAALVVRTLSPAPGAVDAAAHLQAAERQAQGDPALQAVFQRACAPSGAPATAADALQQLRAIEAAHQAERRSSRPRPDVLLHAVVLRGCAAHHATRLQPGASYPVWWHTRAELTSVRPTAGGFEVAAQATTLEGAVAGSRITFARGLHHACFVPSDGSGRAACVLKDNHPHGDRLDGWAQAHEGPFVATVAGSASPTRVELPAVAVREIPVFAVARRHPPFPRTP